MLKWILTLLLVTCLTASAQEDTVPIEELSDLQKFELIKTERLKRIRKELVQIRSTIFVKKKQLKKTTEPISQIRLEQEIIKLEEDHSIKQFLFIETATNIQLKAEVSKDINSKKDLLEEVKEILSPVIESVKRVSERPRRIEKIRNDLTLVVEKITVTKGALEQLKKLSEDNLIKELARTFNRSVKITEKLLSDLKIKKEDLDFKLLKLQNEKGSVVEEFTNLILEFFKTKGKNLLFAFTASLLFFWTFNLVRKRFLTFVANKLMKSISGHPHWALRPIRVLYYVISGGISVFIGLLTLYVLHDWVLVTFILLTLGAVIWSTKEYIPQFFEQTKLVLNIGPIREGERVIFDGLPWSIKGLGFYCRLVNPWLSGGSLRVHSKKLLDSHSRPIDKNEPWFPTKNNDWVILNDDTFGKVVLQTPEKVAVKLIGGAKKYYPTVDFINMNPQNLSVNGYAVEVIFGVDYSHQAFLFSDIIPNFKEKIKTEILSKYEKELVKDVIVDFQQAGASSLDVRFFMLCDGKLASEKPNIERKAQSLFVESCNEKDYIIPFNQLQVHMTKQ